MPEITLNGRLLKVDSGQTVLEAARLNGVSIPTLCHHPGLGPYGACRLCLVEVKGGFRPGLISSCTLPVMNSLVVETESVTVKNARKLVAELLLARAPESAQIRELASGLGVEATGIPGKNELCILCGRCVRTCEALGINAVSFVRRGVKRRVAVPFDKPSEQCMACQACATVCPTGAIKAKVTPDEVEMVEWHTRQALLRCTNCEKPFVTDGQKTRVDTMVESDHQPRGTLCPRCRRLETAGNVASTGF